MRSIRLFRVLGLLIVSVQLNATTNSSDYSMVPIEGSLELSDLGKAVTEQMRIGDDLVEFTSQNEFKEYRERLSSSACHFYASQVKQNGQLVSGFEKDVSVGLETAYQENCQKAVINVYHAVIDGYQKSSLRAARIREDLLADSGSLEVVPAKLSQILRVRRSIGDYYVKKVYTGFLAVMRIEFDFESREDISNMSTIFADLNSAMLVGSHVPSESNQDEDVLRSTHQSSYQSAALAKISASMSRKRINGSWKVATRVIGALEREDEAFPFVETDMSALAGNYDTLLAHMNKFNSWVRASSRSNPKVSASYPILVDLGSIRDSRSLYHIPVPGLIFDGKDISISDLELETSRMFRKIIAAKTGFHSVVNSSSRREKEQKLIELLLNESSHIEYLVQNAIPIDEITGSTILHWAAVYDLPELAEMIVQMDPRGDLLDARDKLGRTPLMRAAANGSSDVALILVNNGASIDYIDSNSYSALTYATMSSTTGTKQVVCAGVGIAGGMVCPPVAFVGLVGEIGIAAQRVVCPDNLCDHVFDCGHRKIARLLLQHGADQSKKANWSQLNTVANALTVPWRTAHKGLRYIGKLGKVDDDRN